MYLYLSVRVCVCVCVSVWLCECLSGRVGVGGGVHVCGGCGRVHLSVYACGCG